MKTALYTLSIITFLSGTAYADNRLVEDALKSRPEYSSFYTALINTGVNRELSPHSSYTLFVPTNAALAALTPSQYPCFYSAECRPQIAQIVRNHIIEDPLFISDTAKQKGGIYSISRRFVTIAEPFTDQYTADGHTIIGITQTGANMFYPIDGVIANPRELSSLQYNVGSNTEVSSVTRKIISDPACGPSGCTEAVTQTTTVTRSLPPTLTPAR